MSRRIGRRLLRREFVRDGPARGARDEAEPLLQVEPVHLVDHAVDVVGERGAVQLDGAVGPGHLLFGLAKLDWRNRKAPVLDGMQDTVIGGCGQRARFAPAPGKEAQGPRGRDRGIELAQRAGRGVARIGEGFAAPLRLPLVERLKVGVAHIDFAANLEHVRHIAAADLLRNIGDGADIGGHVLAFGAVAARRRHRELPALVAQRNGETVDFHLGGEIERGFGAEHQEAPDASHEFAGLVIGEDVAEREHAHGVAHLGEFRRGRRANRCSWAFPGKSGKALLQSLGTLAQLVIVRVRNFGLVFLVIEPVVPLQLAGKTIMLHLRFRRG